MSQDDMPLLDRVLVGTFIAAIVMANLVVYYFGPAALPFTAFFLIPFDLVVRDILYERWRTSLQLIPRMGALVVAGGLISALVNSSASKVALASCIAFSISATVNALVFHVLFERGRFIRMNTSNLLAAITDSILFPLVAFGVMPLTLILSQASAKFVGGLVFTSLFIYLKAGKRNGFRKRGG